MKKLIILLITITSMTSCYDDYVKDFDYSAVYFAYQENARTLVAGEGMKIKIGVTLSGVMENKIDRLVSFKIDPSLLDGTGYSLLPANYYSLSDDSEILIPKGWNQGDITFSGDLSAIATDPDMLPANPQKYALPLVITGVTDVDSVLESKKMTIIPIRYEHTLYGNYLHSGVTTVKDSLDNEIGKLTYHSDVNAPESAIWRLTTMNANSVVINGKLSDLSGNNFEVTFETALEGDALDISGIDGETYDVEGDGPSTFNNAEKLEERMLVLNYKFARDGQMWYAKDTLKFRNRIRDGVNEWQGYGATVR